MFQKVKVTLKYSKLTSWRRRKIQNGRKAQTCGWGWGGGGDTGQWTVPRTPPHPHHSSHVRSLLYSLPPLCMVPFAAPCRVHNIYHMKCAHSPRYWLSTFTYLKHLLSQPLSHWQQSQLIQNSQMPWKAENLGTLAWPCTVCIQGAHLPPERVAPC